MLSSSIDNNDKIIMIMIRIIRAAVHPAAFTQSTTARNFLKRSSLIRKAVRIVFFVFVSNRFIIVIQLRAGYIKIFAHVFGV